MKISGSPPILAYKGSISNAKFINWRHAMHIVTVQQQPSANFLHENDRCVPHLLSSGSFLRSFASHLHGQAKNVSILG